MAESKLDLKGLTEHFQSYLTKSHIDSSSLCVSVTANFESKTLCKDTAYIIDRLSLYALLNAFKRDIIEKICLYHPPIEREENEIEGYIHFLKQTIVAALYYNNNAVQLAPAKHLTPLRIHNLTGYDFTFPISLEIDHKVSEVERILIQRFKRFFPEFENTNKQKLRHNNIWYVVQFNVTSLEDICLMYKMTEKPIQSLSTTVSEETSISSEGSECGNFGYLDALTLFHQICCQYTKYLNSEIRKYTRIEKGKPIGDIKFQTKPLGSLIDKVMCRQKDIHDAIRCTVEWEQFEDLKLVLTRIRGLKVYNSKTTGNDVATECFFNSISYEWGLSIAVPIYIEVQKKSDPVSNEDHLQYEFSRLQMSDRFEIEGFTERNLTVVASYTKDMYNRLLSSSSAINEILMQYFNQSSL